MSKTRRFVFKENLTKRSGSFELTASDTKNDVYDVITSGDEIEAFSLSKNPLEESLGTVTPIAWYKFNGDANDSIGTNNGIVSGATLTDGKYLQAYDFSNLTTDKIEVSGLASTFTQTGNYTVSLWVKPNATGTNRNVWNFNGGGSNRHNLNFAGTVIGYQRYNGIDYTGIIQADSVETGVWQHIVCVNNSGTLTLYKNGISIGVSGNQYAVGPTGNVFVLGYPNGTINGSGSIDGIIDDVRIYDVALTEEQVKEVFYNYELRKVFGGYIETKERSKERRFELKIKGGDYTTKLNQIKIRAQIYNKREYSVIVRDLIHKYINKGSIIDNFDDNTDWSVDGAFNTKSTEDGVDINGNPISRFGSSCLKLTINNSGVFGFAWTYLTNGFDLKTTDRIQCYLYVPNKDSLGAIYLRVGQTNDFYSFLNESEIQDGWNYLIFDLSKDPAFITGSPSLTNATLFGIVAYVNDLLSPYILLDEMRINPNEIKNIATDNVLFTDDYTTASFKGISVHEAIKKITEEKPKDYSFYVDKYKSLHFGIFDQEDGGHMLKRGFNIRRSKFIDDDSHLINNIIIYGARQMYTAKEVFSGSDALDELLLKHEPVDAFVTVDGVAMIGYQEGMTGEAFDYSLDQKNKKLKWETASKPTTGTDNIIANVTYSVPTSARRKDLTSILQHGEREEKKENEYISDKETALAIAEETIKKFKDPIIVGEVTRNLNPFIEIGKTIKVIDNHYFDEEKDLTITEATHTLIGGKTETVLNLSESTDTIEDFLNRLYERINTLEEREKGQSDLLTEQIEFTDTLGTIDSPSTNLVIKKWEGSDWGSNLVTNPSN